TFDRAIHFGRRPNGDSVVAGAANRRVHDGAVLGPVAEIDPIGTEVPEPAAVDRQAVGHARAAADPEAASHMLDPNVLQHSAGAITIDEGLAVARASARAADQGEVRKSGLLAVQVEAR